ncbi:MAG: cbb3-type cytochrome oxidase assembly protein CcoS [Bacteroidetes bacterium]|nr:cbb3-type cytochrome oxidase assembly protein CcoS [Bacteroidota bacterium]
MSAMIILLVASLIVAIIFLLAFIWSVKNGQYDDDVSPAHKILFEDQVNQKSK